MNRIKPRVTLACSLLAVILALASYQLGWKYFVLATLAILVTTCTYRLVMLYLRRCPHCESMWHIERQHYREPYGSRLSRVFDCSTYRTCLNPHCSHQGKEELEKAYLKEFRGVHEKALRFAGLL